MISAGAAALVPILVVAVGFEVFCLVDVARAEEVRYLPKWAWAVICVVSIPFGGAAYLILGRAR
jgi:Phospholipase_D-nuclease N-terminal